MLNKFVWMVALRYLKSKQKSSFVSFISLISILGIAIGVTVLITVLSVMNGFQRDIQMKIIGITAHMQITDASNLLNNWHNVANKAQQQDNRIMSYAPYIDGQALVSFDNNVNGVLVRGINPTFENQVDNIHSAMVLGNDQSLVPGQFNVIIGQNLAEQLGVVIGQKIVIITPAGQITPAGMLPRVKQFTVSGIFNFHMSEYDSSLVLINLHDAQVLFKMEDNVTGIRLKVSDVMQTQMIKTKLDKILPNNLIVTDWIEQHQNYFSAVALEKKMMSVVLFLIIAVAAFNLVSTLVMSVKDKKSDIAILRTMGASKSNIIYIFMLQGGIAGISGTCIGTFFGVILAANIGRLVNFLEQIFHTKLIQGDVYFLDYLPSHIIPHEVFMIFIISVLMGIVATLYPSMHAASVDPVEALRYE